MVGAKLNIGYTELVVMSLAGVTIGQLSSAKYIKYTGYAFSFVFSAILINNIFNDVKNNAKQK